MAEKLAIEPKAAADMVAEIEIFSTFVDAVPQLFTYPRDPKDEPFLNLAIVAGASHLVTRDDDMLDLMNEADPFHAALFALAPNLVILKPNAFLALLRK